MAKMKKYSTTTITEKSTISPWLSASGELAYTPEKPPARDYFFQYGWLFPDIISDNVDKKRHYYFGHPEKTHSDSLFYFWNLARSGKVKQVKLYYGYKDDIDFKAPIAVYQYRPPYKEKDIYLLIQHGSYQLTPMEDQPFLSKGLIIIYRGVGKSKQYKHLKIELSLLNKKHYILLDKYFAVQEKTFSDSALSFTVAHAYVARCETGFLNSDVTWDYIANSMDFEWGKDKFASQLRASYLQGFTIDKIIASMKFGPNYVKCITPISNIRLTTFFAGEHEVNAIDPRKIEILKTIKCKEKAIYLR